MKRDQRLRGLSSEHHHALVLARALEAGVAVPDLTTRLSAELEPHFVIEEEILLPALCAAGEEELAARTLAEHEALRRLAREPDRLRELGRRLREHVRFEERELFAVCEARLDARVLDAVAARRPAP